MARGSRDTQRRIVEAARDLFATSGFHGTGVAAIANAAGVTNAGLYHYFESKEDLLFAVLDEAMGDHLNVLEQIAVLEIPARTALDMALENNLDFVLGKPAAIRVFFGERRFLTGARAKAHSSAVRRYDSLFGKIVSRCVPSLPAEDQGFLRFTLLGMVNWIPEWYDANDADREMKLRSFMKAASLALVDNAADVWAQSEHGVQGQPASKAG